MNANTVRESIRNAVASGSSAIVVFVLITLVLIIGIIAYIVYRVRRADLQSISIVSDPKKLFGMNGTPFMFDAAKLPVTLNGQEFSYSFWLYLLDFAPTADHQVVFARGGSTAATLTVAGASPIVSVDKSTNKLRVSVCTNAYVLPSPVPTTYGVTDVIAPGSGYLTANVDYVPLQRWVNVVAVVRDNLLTLYQDGDIYTVENVSDLPKRPVFSGISGGVAVGGGGSETHGYISKLAYFNYALSARDVRAVYNNGPTSSSVLTMLGVDSYGLRSPIYKTDE
jgi:hypothetical protein